MHYLIEVESSSPCAGKCLNYLSCVLKILQQYSAHSRCHCYNVFLITWTVDMNAALFNKSKKEKTDYDHDMDASSNAL